MIVPDSEEGSVQQGLLPSNCLNAKSAVVVDLFVFSSKKVEKPDSLLAKNWVP
jgi:hypothetical protein